MMNDCRTGPVALVEKWVYLLSEAVPCPKDRRLSSTVLYNMREYKPKQNLANLRSVLLLSPHRPFDFTSADVALGTDSGL